MTDTTIEQYLAQRHAVVTGGGKGIGAAIASELARRGANVTLFGRSAERLKSHAKDIAAQYGVQARAVVCDVTDEVQVHNAFIKAEDELGEVHVLVNNAGGTVSSRFVDITRDDWNHIIALNLTAAFVCTQEVLPKMLKAKAGRIVNIASTAALKGYSHTAAYCAAKHGVLGMTRSLAIEIAKQGVTVNAVCPGYTQTELSESAVHTLMDARGISEQEAFAMLIKPIPRGKLTQPEEVATAVAWLCSPFADAITGIALPIAGGEIS